MTDIDFAALRQTRAERPEAIAQALAKRSRRSIIDGDGRLMIVAADHPARGALGVGGDRAAMSNREQLLSRLVRALARPGVDGVLATPDIIDDLALLGALENKIVVGSMNRGGLSGATFEMDDRFGAYDIPSIVRDGLDFAKTLTRINLGDAGTASTLEATAHAVSAAAEAKVPIMVEPFISEWVDGKILNTLSAEAVILSISISAGLGNSSAYTWLKIPVVENMAAVMESTTLPTLLLGGDHKGDLDELMTQWSSALALPGVRGLVVGRSLLYPQSGDVEAAIDSAVHLVHG
jgi:DhnA family fructose-bisphosphate aldolase class Ia